MIEEGSQIVPLEQKFLVVLDSKIPSTITSNNISKKSDLIFDLESPIIKGVDDLQLKCSVKNAVFPNSMYAVNNLNNDVSITLIYNDTLATASNILITIPPGNYSAYQLINTLQTLINDEYYSLGYTTVTFTITQNAYTNKLIFTLNDVTHLYTDFRISFQASNLGNINSVSQMGDVIGFSNDYDYYSGDLVPAFNTNAVFSEILGIIEAPYPVNTSGLRSFNVILKNYNTSSIPIQSYNSQIGFKTSIKNSNYNSSSRDTTFIRNNIICNVSCNANPFEYIFYDKQNEFFIDIKEFILNRLHIQICDNLGNLLDFNNQDWSITLEFCLLKNTQIKTKSFYEILQSGRF
jgi:hypothetical protein